LIHGDADGMTVRAATTVSEGAAREIAKVYPTLKSLVDAYTQVGTQQSTIQSHPMLVANKSPWCALCVVS